jgi:hypothetical protein
MHELIAKLTKDLNLTPEQQFRVTADIKRHVHEEKASLAHRLMLYAQGAPIFADKGLSDDGLPEFELIGHEEPKDPQTYKILEWKYKTHEHWSKLADEKIVTWNVGSHVYSPKVTK